MYISDDAVPAGTGFPWCFVIVALVIAWLVATVYKNRGNFPP